MKAPDEKDEKYEKDEKNDEQSKLWNGASGRAWIEAQASLDQMFKPFEDLLVETVVAESPRSVLDVGCGTGSTTLAVARALGANVRCTGIDISEPMIAVARARAEREHLPARFISADAQDHAFEPGGVDMIMSRFGVMFFGDAIAAFANLRRAATDNARLRCITWRSAAENPFMTTAERAAAPLLPNLPERRPDGPGQFAFANTQRVATIIQQSGWSAIDLRPVDVTCTLPEKELTPYLTRFGPVGRMLDGVDDQTRARVSETVRTAFDPYVFGAEVRYTAACWMICARGSEGA
jgi:ubiquinone/menaquinone biosynthesis C-methylase UbiE